MVRAVAHSRTLTLAFTDLADSTALKGERGDQAVGDLIERHRAIVRRLAGSCDGRIIDWAGDGCFLTFDAPSAAVMFSLLLQRAHAATPDLPGVRVGLHVGEVSERRGTDGAESHPRVEGLAVDLAARISSIAAPGHVLMSAAVADSARQRMDTRRFEHPVRWGAHGNYLLKGFDQPLEIREAVLEGIASFVAPAGGEKARPVRPRQASLRRLRKAPIAMACLLVLAALFLYAVWREPVPEAASGGGRGTKANMAPAAERDFVGRPAIAVLPFDNLSPDPEQAFFADGLAEDLITRLSSWRAFPVIARNSSFQYRGGDLDLKRVGAELGARYLVEGGQRATVGQPRSSLGSADRLQDRRAPLGRDLRP
ncbi:MAG: hypothetical protein GWN99_09365 [Gemmatimonadetes bacterium]|nr:hypothetical protein [Gemmatimonadota bacterium]